MAELTEEEKEILYRAHEIKERIRAEELEAGEISLEEAKRQQQEELKETFGPGYKEDGDEEEDEEPEEVTVFSREIPQADSAVSDTPPRRQRKRREKKAKGPRKKRKGLRRLIKILIVLIILGALLCVAAYAGIRLFISKTNYQPYETAYVRAGDVVSSPLVTNILLIGTDNRVENDTSRSDAMILVSINRKKGRLSMSSFLRDCYVSIPGYGQNRLNHAYQMGGPALLIQTIEENFKIGVDYYAQVDFYDFMDVIDALGGVGVEVTAEELNYLNGYISEINHKENELAGAEVYPEGYSFVAAAGYQTLNGRQALGYCRIRYIGTDFGRTGRQRTVLEALFKKAKSSNPLKLFEACRTIMPDLTTNISDDGMTKLIMGVPMYLFYDVKQNQVPVDGCWWNALMDNGQEVLGIDFTTNNAALRSAIYD